MEFYVQYPKAVPLIPGEIWAAEGSSTRRAPLNRTSQGYNGYLNPCPLSQELQSRSLPFRKHESLSIPNPGFPTVSANEFIIICNQQRVHIFNETTIYSRENNG